MTIATGEDESKKGARARSLPPKRTRNRSRGRNGLERADVVGLMREFAKVIPDIAAKTQPQSAIGDKDGGNS
eukprot:11052775-Karenia_brevis.AAC.1